MPPPSDAGCSRRSGLRHHSNGRAHGRDRDASRRRGSPPEPPPRIITPASRRSVVLRPTCQLGKVARHVGGCGPGGSKLAPGNEGATESCRRRPYRPPSVRGSRVVSHQHRPPSSPNRPARRSTRAPRRTVDRSTARRLGRPRLRAVRGRDLRRARHRCKHQHRVTRRFGDDPWHRTYSSISDYCRTAVRAG